MERKEAIKAAVAAYDEQLSADAFERALDEAGWAIAPKEPTEAMINAALDEYAANSPYESPLGPDGAFARQYAAMTAAAKETR